MKKSSSTHARGSKRKTGKNNAPPVISAPGHSPFEADESITDMLPTQFELAQLAALLMANKKWTGLVPQHLRDIDEKELTASDAALGLWEQCEKTLYYPRLEKLFLEHCTIVSIGKKKSPAWKEALENKKFPFK